MFRKIAMIAVPTAAFALMLCATGDSASQAFARGNGGHGNFSSHNFGHFNHFNRYWGTITATAGAIRPTLQLRLQLPDVLQLLRLVLFGYSYSYPSYYGYSYPSY